MENLQLAKSRRAEYGGKKVFPRFLNPFLRFHVRGGENGVAEVKIWSNGNDISVRAVTRSRETDKRLRELVLIMAGREGQREWQTRGFPGGYMAKGGNYFAEERGG